MKSYSSTRIGMPGEKAYRGTSIEFFERFCSHTPGLYMRNPQDPSFFVTLDWDVAFRDYSLAKPRELETRQPREVFTPTLLELDLEGVPLAYDATSSSSAAYELLVNAPVPLAKIKAFHRPTPEDLAAVADFYVDKLLPLVYFHGKKDVRLEHHYQQHFRDMNPLFGEWVKGHAKLLARRGSLLERPGRKAR